VSIQFRNGVPAKLEKADTRCMTGSSVLSTDVNASLLILSVVVAIVASYAALDVTPGKPAPRGDLLSRRRTPQRIRAWLSAYQPS
jgi:hypothetical protein